jgi:hypothetical protein
MVNKYINEYIKQGYFLEEIFSKIEFFTDLSHLRFKILVSENSTNTKKGKEFQYFGEQRYIHYLPDVDNSYRKSTNLKIQELSAKYSKA